MIESAISLSLPALARRLVDPSVRVEIDRRFIGRLERHDAWSIDRWPLPWQLIYLIHEGCCRVEGDGGPWQAGPGQAVLFRADRVEGVRFSQHIRFSELRFRLRDEDSDLIPEAVALPIGRATDIASSLDHCVGEGLRESGDASCLLRHHLALLLAQIDRLMSRDTKTSAPQLSNNQRQQLVTWAAEHICHEPSPADLAQVLGYQADYFSRLFKASFGRSPRDWLVDERMRLACRLLGESDLPVAAVAEQLGYASCSHFCRQFRKQLGRSPLRYRIRAGRLP